MKKRLFIIIGLILVVLSGCSKEEDIVMPNENPIVTMTIKGYGDIVLELYPEYAYNTVANFVNLVEDGFYDGNNIIRLQPNFVIQGGGTKACNHTIKGEFATNGYEKNTLSHTDGVISMARTSDPNSACGQFFITLSDDAKYSLDGSYAGFGKVIEGRDVIKKIENSKLDFADTQLYFLNTYITIEKATVDTKGYTYKAKVSK